MDLSTVLCPALLTSDLPGIGGRIKCEPEDFDVEEIAAYEPCGAGEFLFLWIEKRDMARSSSFATSPRGWKSPPAKSARRD